MKPGTPSAINPHLQTGAHALGALPEAERAEFQQHLTRCQSCVDELAGFTRTAALLGAAVDRIYPMALRPVVLDAVQLVHQVPPGAGVRPVHSRRQGFQRAAALVAAACVAAMTVAGVHASLTSPGVRPVTAPPRTKTGDLLAAPDLRLLSAANQTGTAAVSAARDEMLFLANGLRTLPHDRAYQLWLVDARGPRSAGTVLPGTEVTSLLVSGLGGADEVILTAEPAGGSPSPTGAPVVTIALR
ncbi:anti-sigma factor domain-containing protein [Lentzea sp. NPDC058450]|uniref:anti-sigma factor n=1 Tax=Lentzea sp. NPDC058450 TaxID=3346505 RepID=UPI0036555C75